MIWCTWRRGEHSARVPATLQASRDALAAALGGPLRREVLEGYPVSVFDGTGASRMDVDVAKSRTAEEAALPPPMDSPTKRSVSSDVVPEYDLTEHDEDRNRSFWILTFRVTMMSCKMLVVVLVT